MGNPLSELGLASDDGTLSVDHAIVLSMSKTMEETLRHTFLTLTKTTKDANRIMKIVGYAAAAYLVMAGVARIIEASSSSSSRKQDPSLKK
jgi:protein gp37